MIRKANACDIAAIAEIYDEIIKLEEQGKTTTGWLRGVYPTADTALIGVNAGAMFVFDENGTVTAAARIDQIQAPTYDKGNWAYPAPENEVMVLHTLVVSPRFSHCGYGKQFVKFYEEYAALNGCAYLRMDTNERNSAARALYKKLGYNEVGTVPCDFNGIPDVRLVCLEKKIDIT